MPLIFAGRRLEILGRVPRALAGHFPKGATRAGRGTSSHAPKRHPFSPAFPSPVSSRREFAGPENDNTGPFAFVSQNHALYFTDDRFPCPNPTQSRCSCSGFCIATSAPTPGQMPNYLLLLKIYCIFSPPSQNCFCSKIPFKSS